MNARGGQAPDDNDLVRLLSGSEPAELRRYFFVPQEGQLLHEGTTVPVIGAHTQTASGIWVPSSARVASAPIDLMGVFITHEDLVGEEASVESLTAALARYSRVQLLVACANVLRSMHDNPTWADAAARETAKTLRPDLSARLMGFLTQGRRLFTRQGVLALAKLSLVHGGVETTASVPLDAAFGLLIASVHDSLGGGSGEQDDERTFGNFPARLSASIVANQWFNRSFDEANFLAMADRRWNNRRRPLLASIRDQFRMAVGFSLEDQNQVALALWARSRLGNVVFGRGFLDSLPLPSDVVDKVIAHLSMTDDEMSDAIEAGEISDQSLEWNYDTFERFPLVGLASGEYAVIEPSFLLRRCLGWSPLYDVQSRRAEHEMALSTEDYARDVLDAMYGDGPARRLFHEVELQALAPNAKCADAAVDFGDAWVVLEVTARRPLRDLIHGADPSALDPQLNIVLEELRQIAGTARALARSSSELTGTSSSVHLRFYPVVVMTEGFPTNPIMLSAIREAAQKEGTFDGLDAAPIEVIDLVELEMIESIVEAGGPSLPRLLDDKRRSNFWADSVRNYLLSRSDLDVERSVRISETFAEPLERLAARLVQQEAASASTVPERVEDDA